MRAVDAGQVCAELGPQHSKQRLAKSFIDVNLAALLRSDRSDLTADKAGAQDVKPSAAINELSNAFRVGKLSEKERTAEPGRNARCRPGSDAEQIPGNASSILQDNCVAFEPEVHHVLPKHEINL